MEGWIIGQLCWYPTLEPSAGCPILRHLFLMSSKRWVSNLPPLVKIWVWTIHRFTGNLGVLFALACLGPPWRLQWSHLGRPPHELVPPFVHSRGGYSHVFNALSSLWSCALSLSCDVVSNNVSNGWTGASPHAWMVVLALSLILLVATQNKGADSTYHMGIKRWNNTSCGSLPISLCTRNYTEGISDIQNHTHMYAYSRWNFLRKFGPILESASNIHPTRRCRDIPNRINYFGAAWFAFLLRSLQENRKLV